MFAIMFCFFRNLLIILILDKRYMCWLIRIQINSLYKYIAYSLASYYLNIIGSGISWIKSRYSSVSVVSVFNSSIIFCYHTKSLLIISNFLMIDKVIVSNCYQSLVVTERLYLKKKSNRQKAYRHRENIRKWWKELMIMLVHSCIEIKIQIFMKNKYSYNKYSTSW